TYLGAGKEARPVAFGRAHRGALVRKISLVGRPDARASRAFLRAPGRVGGPALRVVCWPRARAASRGVAGAVLRVGPGRSGVGYVSRWRVALSLRPPGMRSIG